MKILIWYGAMAVIVGAASTMSGENEIRDGSSSTSAYIQTSKLIGRKVKSSEGEIGIIKEVVIDRSNGCMAYTIVATGGEGTGITSGGGKIIAVPWGVYSATSDSSVLTVNVDREKIYNAPAFDYTRMDEYARPDYIDNVYSYYGVKPGPRTTVAAGTDVTGTAGATASPGEVASPAAGETDSLYEKPSVRKHRSSAGNSQEASKENPSPKAVRSAKVIDAERSIDRGESATRMTTAESPSENATGPNGNKISRRKASEDTSAPRRNATQESAEEQD